MQKYSLHKFEKSDLLKENTVFLIIFILLNITTMFSYAPYSSDESGYLAQTALLAGLNWSAVAQQLAYFSFGNGILVFGFFKLGISRLLLYRLLLIINALLLSFTFKICIYIIKKLFQDIDENKVILISLIVTIYPRNFCSTAVYVAESYITFTFWMMLFFLVKFHKTHRKLWLLCFGILGVYIFFIHQRTILISLTGIFVLIWGVLSDNKVNKKLMKRLLYCGVFVLIALVTFALLYMYKKYCKPIIWPVNLQGDGANDFSSTPSVYIKNLKSPEFVMGLLKSLAGKIWYLILGTLGFVVVGLVYLSKELINAIKKKKFLSAIIPVFLLCSFGGSLFISAYWQVNPWRVDQIPYGRYMEVLLGPYMMFGIISFLNGYEKYNVKYWLPMMFILGKIAEIYAGEVLQKTSVNELGPTPVIRYLLTDPYVAGEYLKVTILFTGIILLANCVMAKRKEAVLGFLLTLFFVSDIAVQYARIHDNLDNYAMIKDVNQVVDDSKKSIGYLSINLYANELQFLNPEWDFKRIKTYDSIDGVEYLLLNARQYKDFLNHDPNNERLQISFQNEDIIIIQMNNEHS